MTEPCVHVREIRDVHPDADGCSECRAIGDRWVHLRECLTCGHVACCDSSKNRHARHHSERTHHPIVRSFEPGEHWRWCYPDQDYLPEEREGAAAR